MSRTSGQLLVEISVALAVVLLLVTGLVVATTATMRNARLAKSRSAAVKYAQEGMEVTRLMRNKNWDTFRTYSDACTNQPDSCQWCLDKSGNWSTYNDPTNICADNIDNYYGRHVFFDWCDSNSPQTSPDWDWCTNAPQKNFMRVEVIVDWQDGTNAYVSNVQSDFTQWQ